MNKTGLKGKTAVVTGASTGIGRAIAVALASRGVTVDLVARSKNKLLETQKLISQEGGQSHIFPLDLRDIDKIYQFAQGIHTNSKTVDILVNVAGIYHGKNKAYYRIPFTKFTVEEIRTIYEVGTNGTTFLTHALLPFMKKGAHIINISGTFESGAKGWLPYYVSKRAIEDFTVGLAQELADQGILVNGISPSDTATAAYKKFFPEYIHEAMDPKIIGKFIVELCEKENPPTGKIFVLKKDESPREAFHA